MIQPWDELPRRRDPGVTWRSVLWGMLLIPANAYWVVQMEIIRYSAHPTTVSLFFNAVFTLLVVAVLNLAGRRIAPRWALTRGELLVIYVLVAIGSCLAGHDWSQVLVPMLTWPYRFATPENNWAGLFHHYLPSWLMVRDEKVIAGYYEGHSTLYLPEHLQAWALPTLAWCGFMVALLGVMLALNVLLRKQWIDRERLTYPIVQLPFELADPSGQMFRQRLFWIGFSVTAAIDILNSISFLYPTVPHIRIEQFDLRPFITTRPWTAVGWTPISFYPFLIGLGLLMPLDFLFSCWFFYLFWKGELILCAALGWDRTANFPYIAQQGVGAYLVFFLFALWIGRGYLRQVGRCVLGLPSELTEQGEPIRYRWAVLVLLLSFVGVVWFTVAMGLSLWLSVVSYVMYLAISLAITRMRAEFGTPVHDLHFTGPDQVFPLAAGSSAFSHRDLTAYALFFWFNRAYRCHPMPHQLEAFKLAERTNSPPWRWFWMLVLAAGVGAVASFWAMLHLNYDFGARAKAAGSFGAESYNRLASWLQNPTDPNYGVMWAIGVGLVSGLFLQGMRIRFAGWPFHPLGFAVSGSWEMNLVWMPLLIAWVLKTLLLRYGGLKVFRRALPIFFGMILGQFVVGSLLNIISIYLGIPSYMFWQ